jgi:hypothetical protein
MNISLSKQSNSSSKIYTTSRILYISIHLESLVLAGLVHIIVNIPHSVLYKVFLNESFVEHLNYVNSFVKSYCVPYFKLV